MLSKRDYDSKLSFVNDLIERKLNRSRKQESLYKTNDVTH